MKQEPTENVSKRWGIYGSEAFALHNHIGIVHDWKLVRLIGYCEDEMDCYCWTKDRHGKEVKCSMVGAFESLKGKLDRYDQLESGFALNGCPPTDEFKIELR